MNVLFLLIFFASFLCAETITLKLDCRKGDTRDYGAQIREEFAKLLSTNVDVAKQFAEFEASPEEKERGGFTGEPKVVPVFMSVGTVHERLAATGEPEAKEMTALFALHFTYDSKSRREMYSKNGFFALFTVSKQQPLKDGDEKGEPTFSAEFNGFRKATD